MLDRLPPSPLTFSDKEKVNGCRNERSFATSKTASAAPPVLTSPHNPSNIDFSNIAIPTSAILFKFLKPFNKTLFKILAWVYN